MYDCPWRKQMTPRQHLPHLSGISALSVRLVLSICVTTGAGCSSLTSVDAPDVIQPPDAGSPAGANALRIGAITTFYTWFGSGPNASSTPDNMVTYIGLLSDELVSGDPPTANTSTIDARRLSDPRSGFSQY